ncbi:MAG TPA: dihydrofolate reductase family protein [Solirubrobacteraceae bacterium]|nr:dihydrofolate reductase family protein [Solirubrobacteraceae bacterium]
MSKLVVSQFVTVDGVFEDPGGGEASPYGGWAFQFERGPDGDKFKVDEVMAAGALLLGRVTYEGFAAAWPQMDADPFGQKMNGMPKYVVSSTLRDPEWNNTSVIDLDRIPALKDEVEGDLLLNGSGQLTRALAERGLIDEYRLMVYPIVLGQGRRLFDGLGMSRPLRLVASRPAGETVILTYQAEA